MPALAPLLIALLLAAPALRLLGLAARTRQRPELWAGVFFLGVAIGIPLRLIGANTAVEDPAAAAWINTVGHVGFASGACALYAFVCEVFHPARRGARLGAGAGIAAIVGTTAVLLTSGGVNDEESVAILLVNTSRVAPIVWAFVESLRYYRLMCRRESLGLGDAVVANRFLLWSLWTGALGLLPGISVLFRIVNHVARMRGTPFGDIADLQQGAVGVLGVVLAITAPVAIVALWLSFFPPRSYLQHLASRSNPSPC